MRFNWISIATVAAPLLAVLLNWLLERRPNLISYMGYASGFLAKDPSSPPIFTHSVVIKNVGRKSATNIRVGHGVLPETYLVFPQVQYSLHDLPNGGKEIVFPKLVPKEEITISYIYFLPLRPEQINLYAKSDECLARIFTAIPTPQPPRWVTRIAQILVLIGISAVVYLSLSLINVVYSIIVNSSS